MKQEVEERERNLREEAEKAKRAVREHRQLERVTIAQSDTEPDTK